MSVGNPITDAIGLFDRFGVDNVLVGGAAVILHGSAYATQDVDFCCRWDDVNLAKMADALNSINPKLRVEGLLEGLPIKFDVKYLRQYASVALDTDIGFVDVRKSVDGIGGFEHVKAMAEEHTIGGYPIHLLSLNGLIQSKSFMNRPRDRAVLPELKMMKEAREVEAGNDISKKQDDRSNGR